ncbi:MAG: serine hydrolase domain-containing protein [Pseudomonadota bacterium]
MSIVTWGNAGTRLDLGTTHVPHANQINDVREQHTPLSLRLINPYLKRQTQNQTRAGYAIATAQGGQLRFAVKHGVADLDTQTPIEIDTRFRIASMTKPITAVAAMILVERGLINLDDPIEKYIPAFADVTVWENGVRVSPKTAPTIHHLLTFSAGIGSTGGGDQTPLDKLWSDKLRNMSTTADLETRVDTMATLPLCNHPGEKWHYASSLTVIARVIEVASGIAFEDFLEREIFAPLGMMDTGFMPPPEEREDIAALYTHNSDGSLVVRPDAPFHSKGRVSGDGRLISTLPDYMRFAMMLWNGGAYNGVQILSEDAISKMTTPYVTDGVLSQYDIEGLGWGYGLAIVMDAAATPMPDKTGDFFWSGVNGTHFWISPHNDTVFVYMTQYRAPAGESGRPRGSEIPFVVQAVVNSRLD